MKPNLRPKPGLKPETLKAQQVRSRVSSCARIKNNAAVCDCVFLLRFYGAVPSHTGYEQSKSTRMRFDPSEKALEGGTPGPPTTSPDGQNVQQGQLAKPVGHGHSHGLLSTNSELLYARGACHFVSIYGLVADSFGLLSPKSGLLYGIRYKGLLFRPT